MPPSSTLVPLATAIASSPPPLCTNQLGVVAVMFRLSVVILIYCLLQAAYRSGVRCSQCRHRLIRRGILDRQDGRAGELLLGQVGDRLMAGLGRVQ